MLPNFVKLEVDCSIEDTDYCVAVEQALTWAIACPKLELLWLSGIVDDENILRPRVGLQASHRRSPATPFIQLLTKLKTVKIEHFFTMNDCSIVLLYGKP